MTSFDLCRSATSASDWILPLPLLRFSECLPCAVFKVRAEHEVFGFEVSLPRTLKTIQSSEFFSQYINWSYGSV